MASFNLELNIACEHQDEMFYDKAGQFIVVYLVLSGFFFLSIVVTSYCCARF